MQAVASSLDLFSGAMLQLVDDAQGGIRYWPGFLDPGQADAWFHALRSGAAWKCMSRPMYDRIVEVPRLLASYSCDELPQQLPLAAMLSSVQRQVPAPYNSIGLNLYRDGHDSVAMHSDKLHQLLAPHPIVLVSLGAPRRMLIRGKAGVGSAAGRTVAVDLDPGSLLCMSHASQTTHDHGIPKTRRAQGPRLSAVFRVRPAARGH